MKRVIFLVSNLVTLKKSASLHTPGHFHLRATCFNRQEHKSQIPVYRKETAGLAFDLVLDARDLRLLTRIQRQKKPS